MGVVTYALFCYGLTAVISFLLIGIIMGINRVASRAGQPQNPDRQG
jgi:F0F1-type ATP synthase assembly protein I